MTTQYKPLKTKRFSTGIHDIDEQHEQLYDTIQIFYCDEKSIDTLWNILLDVEKYTEIHFATEEKYMKKLEYPHTEEHSTEHRFFTKKFQELKKTFTEEGFSREFVYSFRDFLTSWLSAHYTGSDIQLADFINARLSEIAQNK